MTMIDLGFGTLKLPPSTDAVPANAIELSRRAGLCKTYSAAAIERKPWTLPFSSLAVLRSVVVLS